MKGGGLGGGACLSYVTPGQTEIYWYGRKLSGGLKKHTDAQILKNQGGCNKYGYC